MTTDDELDTGKLREVAEAATEGPWRWEWYRLGGEEDRSIPCHLHGATGGDSIVETDSGVYGPRVPDAIHIATFDPPTVLRLLDRLEFHRQTLRLVGLVTLQLQGVEEMGHEDTQEILREREPWLWETDDAR